MRRAYDAAGNVLDFRTYENGSQTQYKTFQYHENHKNWYSDDDGQETTYSFDKSARTTEMVLKQDASTYYYDYSYHADGRTKAIKAHGDSAGNSSFTYDANERQARVDLGQGDSQSRAEYTTFLYNNDGKIVYKYHDDGDHDNREQIEYAYVDGHPVGETGTDVSGNKNTLLDTGTYSLVRNLGEDTPGTALNSVIPQT